MAASIHQLLPEVAEKFRCTVLPGVIVIQRLGRTIDLRTLTLAEAEELVKDPKFTYLVPIRKRKKAAPASTVN
jgi:hypothetical protein